jgi:hypothetical protein
VGAADQRKQDDMNNGNFWYRCPYCFRSRFGDVADMTTTVCCGERHCEPQPADGYSGDPEFSDEGYGSDECAAAAFIE